MRILIVCGLFYPAKLGGPANTLFWLSKALVSRGHEVFVVTSSHQIDDNRIKIDDWNDVEGVQVRYCKIQNKLGRLIVRWAKEMCTNVDVVVLSSVCYLPNLWVAKYALKKGIRVVWSPRGELLGEKVKKDLFKTSYFRYIKQVANNRIVFHATSTEEKESIRLFFGDKCQIHVIPNYFILPTKQDRCETECNYFLYVGRIAPIKMIHNIIEALSISECFKSSNYTFKVVGGVEPQFENYGRQLKDQINNLSLSQKVQFVGPVHGDEKYKYYANAKALFLVSKSENFGNVIIESLSQGTPVVASKGTPWRVLNDVKAGFWIENSPEKLASCIDGIIQMPTENYIEYRDSALALSHEFDVYEKVMVWEQMLK